MIRCVVGASLLSVLGCLPARSVLQEAAAVERSRCSAQVEEPLLAPVFTETALESVEPLYVHEPSRKAEGGGHVGGALLRIHPIPATTAERLGRALECHSARRVLGRIPASALPNDPFFLPGRLVDIDAEAAGDGFEVAVRSNDFGDAQEILLRARARLAGR